MSSPRLPRIRSGENGDLENAASSSTNVSSGDSSVTSSTLSSSSSSSNRDYLSSVRTGKAGMSDYTSQRLAELRLRRTESETASSLSDYRSSKTNGYDSTASKSSSSSIRQNESFSAGDQKSREFYTSKSSSRSVGGGEDEFVGFATLPDQVHRKAVKRGFDFTLMVVGESGLGKSTLINSLFLKDLYEERNVGTVDERLSKTVQIEKNELEIEEKGVKLRLTIVDTPGFNDSLDGNDSWQKIESYIKNQFDQYFNDESGLNRKNIKDHRVHCCLYFISPFGHGLRPMDIKFMKQLHELVNIVPVIAKADTLLPNEVRRLKSKVLDQVDEHGIHIYEFPECDSDEDDEFKQQDRELKESVPFAVIGSNTVVEVNGKKVRGRLYPWGIVEVDNPKHSDFQKLRQMLISTHMQDLKDLTRDVHYENYRAKHITEQMVKGGRERNKLKRDSSPNFEAIMATDQALQQKDLEIKRMQEMLIKMQHQLNKQADAAIKNAANSSHGNGLKNL